MPQLPTVKGFIRRVEDVGTSQEAPNQSQREECLVSGFLLPPQTFPNHSLIKPFKPFLAKLCLPKFFLILSNRSLFTPSSPFLTRSFRTKLFSNLSYPNLFSALPNLTLPTPSSPYLTKSFLTKPILIFSTQSLPT